MHVPHNKAGLVLCFTFRCVGHSENTFSHLFTQKIHFKSVYFVNPFSIFSQIRLTPPNLVFLKAIDDADDDSEQGGDNTIF